MTAALIDLLRSMVQVAFATRNMLRLSSFRMAVHSTRDPHARTETFLLIED